mmetsp:Transcript_12907/g.31119  ORF Transcript_12907/g.31119 Transcript_12907/m.31119 type:complete len:100 (-) Transcript_12907:74-373(-)
MEENMYEGEFYMLYVMANMSEGVKFQYCEGKRKRRTIFGTRDWGYFLQFLGRENERTMPQQQQPNIYDRGLASCGGGWYGLKKERAISSSVLFVFLACP